MLLEQLLKLILLFLIPIHSHDLKKMDTIYIKQNTVDNQEIYRNGLPSCDLTKNVCDINCCDDQDCSTVELDSFDCPRAIPIAGNPLFKDHYCDVATSENLEARAFVCIQQVNSPYLGEFYSEDEEDSHEDVANILQARRKMISGFPKEPRNIISTTVPESYLHGSYIYKLDGKTKTSNISIPSNIIKETGFCTERPIRFMVDMESYCMHTLTEDACISASHFNLRYFTSSKLSILSGSNGNNFSITPKIQCTNRGFEYLTFSKNIFQQVLETDSVPSSSQECRKDYTTRFNKHNRVCENVILKLNYTFKTNHSVISDGEINVLLGDVPLSVDSFMKISSGKYELKQPVDTTFMPVMYLSQYFSVNFEDHETSVPEMKREGYKLRDVLRPVGNHSSS